MGPERRSVKSPRARVGSSESREVVLRYANSDTFHDSKWWFCEVGEWGMGTRWPVERTRGLGALRALSRAETRAVDEASSARWRGVKMEDEGEVSDNDRAANAEVGLLGTLIGSGAKVVVATSSASM